MSELYYVIFHNNCPDGMTSSWIYLKYCRCKNINLENVVFVPANAGKVPTDLSWDKARVIMLDISFRKENLLEISSKASSIIILDHHKSAQDNLTGEFPNNVKLIFNMEKCGAQLTWDEFFPNVEYPWYIEVVADRDLWRWKFPNSKPIGKYLMYYGYFENRDLLDKLDDWNTSDIENAENT